MVKKACVRQAALDKWFHLVFPEPEAAEANAKRERFADAPALRPRLCYVCWCLAHTDW